MGSGKDPTVQATTPAPIQTTTPVGSTLDAEIPTLDISKDIERGVDRKKLGTRGLVIPMEAEKSTTITNTPASTGLQI